MFFELVVYGKHYLVNSDNLLYVKQGDENEENLKSRKVFIYFIGGKKMCFEMQDALDAKLLFNKLRNILNPINPVEKLY